MTEDHRQTGPRKYPANRDPDPRDAFSQKAAENKKPPHGVGLTRPTDETNADTRESDGVNLFGAAALPPDEKEPRQDPSDIGRSKNPRAP